MVVWIDYPDDTQRAQRRESGSNERRRDFGADTCAPKLGTKQKPCFPLVLLRRPKEAAGTNEFICLRLNDGERTVNIDCCPLLARPPFLSGSF